MSQILIIDIQSEYKKWISSDLENKIRESTKNYSSIVYLWDNLSGNDVYSEIPFEWMEDELFYDSLNIVSKQYGFFRDLIDSGVDSDEIVQLAQFLIRNKINDWRDIFEYEEIHQSYLSEFKNSELLNYSSNNYSFYIPSDLISDLEGLIKDGVVLVGGARFQCLKEISLLLQVLNIKHTIDEELTYS